LLAEIHMVSHNEIVNFIDTNSKEDIHDYYEKLLEKQKDLDSRITRISLYFILAIFLFYVLPFTVNTSVQLGPISISNPILIYKLIPIFFSYIFLEYAIVTNCKGQTMKLLKILSSHIYKQKIENDYFKNRYRVNFFTRLVLPFSFWSELNNALEKKVGCIGALLLIPAFSIIFIPFYFEFTCIKFILLNYWSSWLTKISIILSVWLLLVTSYFFYQTMSQTNTINKEDDLN
jgi:hypothetical protein